MVTAALSEAEALTVTVEPLATIALFKGLLIDTVGAVVSGAFTVNAALLLVMFPAEFVTTTLNNDPLSDKIAAGVVYDAEVAPLIVVPLFRH